MSPRHVVPRSPAVVQNDTVVQNHAVVQNDTVARNLAPRPGSPVAVAALVQRRGLLRWIVVLFLAAGLVAMMVAGASGQAPAYDEMAMNNAFADPKVVKRMETAARNYSGNSKAEEAYAKVYFGNYFPAKITQADSLLEMNALIKNATTLLTRSQRGGGPRGLQVLRWVFPGMKKVAEGNHHPPARINALLILGRLDETPADQANRVPPVPLRYSRPILIAQYIDESNVDGVRAAALTGLHRSVSYGLLQIPANEKATIQTAMTELLSSDPPAGRSENAHAYMQRFAVDILDLLRPQNDSGLGVQLISISTESKKPDLIALHSAARLGRMSAEMKGKVTDPDDLLARWSTRALSAFESELARLNAIDRPAPTAKQPLRPEDYFVERESAASNAAGGDEDMMRGMDMDMDSDIDMGMEGYMDSDMQMQGMDMGMGMRAKAKPQPPEVKTSRRKLNHVLQQIHLGVTGSPSAGMPRSAGGVLAMVTEEQKPTVEAWVLAMEPIVVALNEEMLDDQEKYVAELEVLTELVREIAGPVDQEPAADPVADAALEPVADAPAPGAALDGLVAP